MSVFSKKIPLEVLKASLVIVIHTFLLDYLTTLLQMQELSMLYASRRGGRDLENCRTEDKAETWTFDRTLRSAHTFSTYRFLGPVPKATRKWLYFDIAKL